MIRFKFSTFYYADSLFIIINLNMEIEETNRILLDFFDKAGLTKVSSVMRSELLKSKKNWK